MQEFTAADYVFKCFCEVDLVICLITISVNIYTTINCASPIMLCILTNLFTQNNDDGQRMLASTLIPQPHLMTQSPLEEDVNMSFGRYIS